LSSSLVQSIPPKGGRFGGFPKNAGSTPTKA
jgi:hypothetical protein